MLKDCQEANQTLLEEKEFEIAAERRSTRDLRSECDRLRNEREILLEQYASSNKKFTKERDDMSEKQ
jgi:hypothetical protein